MLKIAEIGAHLDLGDTAVRDWLKRLQLTRASSLDDIRVAYIRSLRDSASGSTGTAGHNLTEERARLSAEQADRVAMENAQKRGDLVSRALVESTLADVGRQAVAILDAVPAQIKRKVKGATPAMLKIVRDEIDKARHAMADIKAGEPK